MTQEIIVARPSKLRRAAVALAVGAVIGFALSSVAGPSVIGWWYEPPIKDAFSCASSVRGALKQFVTMQLVCAAVGAVVLALIVFLVSRSRGGPVAPSASA
jgi:large-conductance mechanosensitive channel